MNRFVANISMLLASSVFLGACSMYPFNEHTSNHTETSNHQGPGRMVSVNTGRPSGTVGGNLAGAMSEADRNKMYHALDSSPGKSTQWVSTASGISYTVTPIKKVTIGENPFCREYAITAVKGTNEQHSNGTACIAADGNWQSVK